MSLIARALEDAGIATTSVSAARDITAAARPSRAVFVDVPHGHTTGRLDDPAFGEQIVRAALELSHHGQADTIVDLPVRWADSDDWKDQVFLPQSTNDSERPTMIDDRIERFDSPQFQTVDDEHAAHASHAGQQCLVCAGIDI